MATNLGSALSNVGKTVSGYPKSEGLTSTKKTPEQTFAGDGNTVTTAKTGTTLQPSTPYWTKNGYDAKTNVGRGIASSTAASTETPQTYWAGGVEYNSSDNSPVTQAQRHDLITNQQATTGSQSTAGSSTTASTATPSTTTPTIASQTAASTTDANESTGTVDYKDTITQEQLNIQLDKMKGTIGILGHMPDWAYDPKWYDVPLDKFNWVGMRTGAAPPDWVAQATSIYHPYVTGRWIGKEGGVQPTPEYVRFATEWENEENWKDSDNYYTNNGKIYEVAHGLADAEREKMDIADYAEKHGMSEEEVVNAFGAMPTETAPDDTTTGTDDTTTEDGDDTNSFVPDVVDTSGSNTGQGVADVESPEWVSLGFDSAQEYVEWAMNNNPMVGPNGIEDQFYQSMMDRIDRNYGQSADDLRDDVNFQAEQQGMFSGLDKQGLLLREQRELQEAKNIEKSDIANEFTYTGIERERLRNEHNQAVALEWKGMDRQEQKDINDFLLGSFQAEIDQAFSAGQIDLGWFNAKVAEKLGISQQKLTEYGYDLQAWQIALNEMVANAQIEQDWMNIQLTSESVISQLDEEKQRTYQSMFNFMTSVAGIATGGGA